MLVGKGLGGVFGGLQVWCEKTVRFEIWIVRLL